MFYDALKEACEKRKTSPSAVCTALGYSRSNVTNWKRGKNPTVEMLVNIADHLKVNPAKLISK